MNKNNVDIFDTLSPDDLMIKVNVEDERPRKSLVVYISDEAGSDSQRISYLKQLFYSNNNKETIARLAVEQADALIEELKKK